MFLVGKADPDDPDRARKLSGLVQSGTDVDMKKVLEDTKSKAKDFDYHHLLLPYCLFVNHYDVTSKQFKEVLKKVEEVERHIMDELQKSRRSTSIARVKACDGDGLEPNYWGLAKQSNSLHEASMEVVELARRRQFEDKLVTALTNNLEEKSRMLLDIQRYDRWAKSHQLDIERMPGRIDSLKNLVSNKRTAWTRILVLILLLFVC